MKNIRIREISDIEPYRERFLRFAERNRAPNLTRGRIDWLYPSGSGNPRNPCGATATWLAFSEDQADVIGCGSIYPWAFHSGGIPIRTAVATDFRVDDRHRVFGPAVGIQRAITSAIGKKGYEIAFVYPNEESSKVFGRAGYASVGRSREWVRMMRSQEKISRFVKFPLLQKILATFLDGILKGSLFLRYRQGNRGFRSEIVDRCTDAFDVLWEREKRNFNLMPEKTSGFLNWRYADHPVKDHRFYCLHDGAGTLCGFVVFSTQNAEVIIKDIFPPSGRNLDGLIWNFLYDMNRRGYHTVRLSFFGCREFIRTIRRYGFIEDRYSREYMFFFPSGNSDDYLRLLEERRAVYLFFG